MTLFRFAHTSEDDQEIRSEKTAIFFVSMSCCVAGAAWSGMYFSIFGAVVAAYMPLGFTVLVGGFIGLTHIFKKHRLLIYVQIISIISFTYGIQWLIGGVFDSGAVLLWAFTGPLVALMFLSARRSAIWFGVFIVGALVTVTGDNYFDERGLAVSESTKRLLFTLNLVVMSMIVFAFTGYFVRSALRERKVSNELLLNVLPKKTAESLKEGQSTIAERFDEASILFLDMEGSTPLFARLDPADAVEWLNGVFSVFDECVESYGLEKLRTIGDAYIVASGIPDARDEHASDLVACALDMIKALERIPTKNGHTLRFRLGINSGPVVAGVIGKTKFHFDVWGDTVNVASRMESTGEPNRLHISQATFDLVHTQFEFEPRGPMQIKGKGQMNTWFVEGPKKS